LDFEEAVAKAPPGWRHFSVEDIARLPDAVRKHEMARVPAGERGERLVRALFWTLVYHLEPARWDELARYEPIHPGVIEALPAEVTTAVDVGAGSGRLTEHLARRARRTVAVEPADGLRALLQKRLPGVRAIAGWAEDLPLTDGESQLTAACGAFGPDPVVLAELQRVTARGGTIALVSPEQPEWFAGHGWRRVSLPPLPAPPHPRRIDEFFGPPDPPHELVLLRVETS
jgi:SAM-dependent methyltransferase